MHKCLICQTAYEPFISFGRMPIANGFLTPEEFSREYFFELKVGACPKCSMVQLAELVEREKMFHAEYAFFSSTSMRMKEHFRQFSEYVVERYCQEANPFVIEIGSNDGILLQNFAARGIAHLGIEPSANVAQVANQNGIRTICEFFDDDLARRIVAQDGQVDAFMGANVMCHIPTLHGVMSGIEILLKPKGVLVFEDPYLGDILEKVSYDQIYDEHAFYFSVESISYLVEQHGLEVIDVLPQPVHGGSMRYVVAHRGARPVAASVANQREREAAFGLHDRSTFERLRAGIEESRDELVALLLGLRQAGRRVVGYAATSKSTTVINYCQITAETVEFISDTTPIKQGKYSPGMHIPVRPHAEFAARYPDYALLFGWNHAGEIMSKEQAFRASGGQWIVYVPRVEVLR
ncbi:MAG: methyltransferase domain-containing protein [Acidobacteriota bacterium]